MRRRGNKTHAAVQNFTEHDKVDGGIMAGCVAVGRKSRGTSVLAEIDTLSEIKPKRTGPYPRKIPVSYLWRVCVH